MRGEVEGEVVELVMGRLVHPEPDEALGLTPGPGDRLTEVHRLAPAVRVEGAVDDHGPIVGGRGGGVDRGGGPIEALAQGDTDE